MLDVCVWQFDAMVYCSCTNFMEVSSCLTTSSDGELETKSSHLNIVAVQANMAGVVFAI